VIGEVEGERWIAAHPDWRFIQKFCSR